MLGKTGIKDASQKEASFIIFFKLQKSPRLL
jgi:hypothetical protein